MNPNIGNWRAQFMSNAPWLALGAAFLLTPPAWSAAPAKPAKVGVSKPATPKPAEPSGDPVLGKDKADSERCIECHGLEGRGSGHANSTEAKFAKLAGQKTAYLIKQIRDFRSGQRKHDLMFIVANNLSDEDLFDITAYFGSLSPMKGEGSEAKDAGKGLFDKGDAERGIAACITCHGPKGSGQGALEAAPRLAGQEWKYLDTQLRSWRDGSRKNSPSGVMSQLAQSLTDREIEAVSEYLSTQVE